MHFLSPPLHLLKISDFSHIYTMPRPCIIGLKKIADCTESNFMSVTSFWMTFSSYLNILGKLLQSSFFLHQYSISVQHQLTNSYSISTLAMMNFATSLIGQPVSKSFPQEAIGLFMCVFHQNIW